MEWVIVSFVGALAYTFWRYIQTEGELFDTRMQLRDVEGCYKIACEERDLYCELLQASEVDEVEAEEMEVNSLLASDQEGAYVE